MKYTWEKLNYEMLEFSNRTLDLMLSDDLETKLNDVDFTFTPSLSFDTQLENLTGTTIDGSATGNTIFKSNYERMQYLLGRQNQASCGVPRKIFALGTN